MISGFNQASDVHRKATNRPTERRASAISGRADIFAGKPNNCITRPRTRRL